MPDKNKRAQIKREAAKLFRRKGYKSTSMQDIADALDIKAASLYNHISSKQEILKELLMTLAQSFTQGMEDIDNSGLNAYEKLQELVKLHVEQTLLYEDSIALITGEWVHLDEPDLANYLSHRNNYENRFREILKKCQDESHISENVNLDLALYSILSSLHWLYNWYSKHPDLSKIELSRQLNHILLNGLIKR